MHVDEQSTTMEPWVVQARLWMTRADLAWPIVTIVYAAYLEGFNAIIGVFGIGLYALVFVPIAALFAVVIPTVKSRLLGVPLQSSSRWSTDGIEFGGAERFSGIDVRLFFVPWAVTFAVPTLYMPEVRTVRRFYARLLGAK